MRWKGVSGKNGEVGGCRFRFFFAGGCAFVTRLSWATVGLREPSAGALEHECVSRVVNVSEACLDRGGLTEPDLASTTASESDA